MLRLLPAPMADNYLLEMLPGLTLAQIDSMDMHRLGRALQVRRMQDIEARRRLYLDEKLKADALTAEEWRTVAYHDKLLGISDG